MHLSFGVPTIPLLSQGVYSRLHLPRNWSMDLAWKFRPGQNAACLCWSSSLSRGAAWGDTPGPGLAGRKRTSRPALGGWGLPGEHCQELLSSELNSSSDSSSSSPAPTWDVEPERLKPQKAAQRALAHPAPSSLAALFKVQLRIGLSSDPGTPLPGSGGKVLGRSELVQGSHS